jgi:O-antigen/teichoic acid export membrane protein
MVRRWRALAERVLGDDRRLESLFRGSALVLATQVVGIGLAYAMQVVIARWAGAFEFGVFAYAWTCMNLLLIVGTIGLGDSALRLIPSYSTHQDWPKLRGLVLHGPLVILVLAGTAGLLAVGVIVGLGDRVGGPYRTALLWTFAATPLFGLLAFFQGVGRAFGSVFTAFLPRYIGLPLLVMLAVAGFIAAGSPPDAAHLMVATIAAGGVLMVVQALALLRGLPAEAKRATAESPVRAWLRLSTPLLFINICYALLTHCDLLMVGFFLSASDVAVYQAASRTAALISFPLLALNALVAPMIARLHAEKRPDELQRTVVISTQVVFWPSLLAALAAVAAGKLVLGLFGDEFERGHLTLTILVLGHMITVGSGPVTQLMTMTGHQDRCAVVWAITVVGQFVISLFLIPRFGIVGAAVGTVLATCTLAIWLTILVQRRLNIRAHALVPVRQTLARAIRL